MEPIHHSTVRRGTAAGALAAVLVTAGLAAACSGAAGPAATSALPTTGAGTEPTPTPATTGAIPATPTSSPGRPSSSPTAPHRAPRPAPPRDPQRPRLRAVAIPAACQLNAPADAVQSSADAGHLPWRLTPAAVVLQCLRRSLGAADWRISRTGTDTAAVAEPRSRLLARVRLDQPARHGSGGIWDITGIDANQELILPPACVEPNPAALQAAFDQGHQPWRGDPVAAAEACVAAAYGWPRPRGTLVSADHVSVVDDTLGENAYVQGRRWRPGADIWLVTSILRDVGQD